MFGRRSTQQQQRNREAASDPADEMSRTPEACAQTLESIPLFARMSPADRRKLCTLGVMRSYAAGERLITEGQRRGMGLFVILRGEVQLTQHAEDSAMRELPMAGPGDLLGEMALLDDAPRSATAIAATPTLALLIPIVDFRLALANNPDAAAWLLRQLARRIRDVESHGPRSVPL